MIFYRIPSYVFFFFIDYNVCFSHRQINNTPSPRENEIRSSSATRSRRSLAEHVSVGRRRITHERNRREVGVFREGFLQNV